MFWRRGERTGRAAEGAAADDELAAVFEAVGDAAREEAAFAVGGDGEREELGEAE